MDAPGKRRSILLFLFGTINLLTTMGIYWIVMTEVGAGPESDAFFVAMVVPQFAMSVLQTVLSHVLIPVLSSIDKEQRYQLGWTFFVLAMLLPAALALVLLATRSIWVAWLAPGLAPDALQLTNSIIAISLFAMILAALRGVCVAVQQAQRRFVLVEFVESIGGLVSIVFLYFAIGTYGVVAASLALVLRLSINTAFLAKGLGPLKRPSFSDPRLAVTWSRAWPLLAGNVFARLDIVVDRVLGSLAGPGMISLLAVGQQLFGAANLLVYTVLNGPSYPDLSVCASEGDWKGFRRIYRGRLIASALVTSGGILALVVIGRPILGLLVGHGAFSDDSVALLWQLMIALFGFLVGGAMGQVLSMAFYAMGDTRTPVIVGVVGFCIGAVLKLAGLVTFGAHGIALATTAYYLFNVVVLEVFLARKLRKSYAEA